MFERFTKRARSALAYAQAEAHRLGHNYLGTEHVLLGLLVESEGVAGQVLTGMGVGLGPARREVGEIIGPVASRPARGDDAELLATIGVDFDQVREAAEEAFGPGALEAAASKQATGYKAPRFTPRAKKTVELALREALGLGHSYIGTEHLLLGLCRLDQGVAVQVLVRLGADPASVRERVIDELAN